MPNTFFTESKDIRERLRARIIEKTKVIPNPKLRDIILQRHSTSSLLKGVISYFIHEGVGGSFSEDQKLELASGIEIFCSAGALLDNVIDSHKERNGQTTYLKEYGEHMQLAASQYVLHQGLKILLPFISNFSQHHSHRYKIDQAVIGMVGMDIEPPETLDEQIKVIEESNGIFNSVPLVITATTGTEDENKIDNIERYGHNLGSGLAIYEEIRDLLGEHGRNRATEVERGRFIIPLYYTLQRTDLDSKKYMNRKLEEQEYTELIQKIVRSGAITMSADLARLYLNRSQLALREAVDDRCYQKLINLTESIFSSFNELVSNAEDKYGK